MTLPNLSPLFSEFQSTYAEAEKDNVWRQQSSAFWEFWRSRIASSSGPDLSDDECDKIIRFLDRNAKGNSKATDAIAKAMIAQGAWRRMFVQFRNEPVLRNALNSILTAPDLHQRAHAIDELYRLNEGRRNHLTGPSGNAIGAFLALADPIQNVSVISLKDRKLLLDYLGVTLPFDWATVSIGQRIADTNDILLDALRKYGIQGSARTLSEFCYSHEMRTRWKDVHTVNRIDQDVDVVVPAAAESEADADDGSAYSDESLRESMQVQALLARIGASMGFAIWLPKADRSRVTKAWKPDEGQLLEDLPLGYDTTTMKTIEQIDVLWLKRRTIIRAFEVEHTTSVYSGLLRMADLVALQPNLRIKLHIVAPENKRGKVFLEIRRPVFALLEGCPLSELCTYLSYASVKEIADSKLLAHLSDSVIEEYEESAD